MNECPNCNAPNPTSCCCGDPFPLKGDYDAAVEGIADALAQYVGSEELDATEHYRNEARHFLLTLGIVKDA